MVAFLGVDAAGLIGVGNAPPDLRADTLVPQGSRLRYVGCPQAPFIDDTARAVCDGK